MKVMNSGSPFEKFQQQQQIIPWDVITYAFERRSGKKMWVRAFLYAAIWSLENGPGNTSLLVQYHQHNKAFC